VLARPAFSMGWRGPKGESLNPSSYKEIDNKDDQQYAADAASYYRAAIIVSAASAKQQQQYDDDQNNIQCVLGDLRSGW
jgi:hypothetical protein